jgi:hypothetical protein
MTFIFILIVFIAGVKIITNWRKKVTVKPHYDFKSNANRSTSYSPVKVEKYYNSNCWNCNSSVDSRGSNKCYKCKRFNCRNCWKCLCEKQYKPYSSGYKKEWQLQSTHRPAAYTKQEKSDYSKPYYSSSKSGYSSQKQMSNSYSKAGYCKRCSKKLKGDTSKHLCYECWKK